VSDLQLKVRGDLVASLQGTAPNEYYVVKDPSSRRYFRLRPPEWWFVQQFNGARSLSEVGEAFQARFQARLEPAALSAFVERLISLGLFEGERSEKESSALSRRQSGTGLERLFFIKLKAVDPDDWLGAVAARLRLLLRPWFWPASLAVVVSALWLVSRHSAEFTFTLASLLTVQSIGWLVLTMFLVIALHEIAHGVVCRHLGGHVHEMGFLLLYFQPCLYCDLSDAWMFRERWKKVLVTFSGAYFQILLGALGVWGWRITVPGTWVNDLFWLLAIVSLFNVLFNFNPLIKLDGYYLLSDGLGIPNLRTRAFAWMSHRVWGGDWGYALRPSRRERLVYWLYGPLAVTYSALLVGYLVWISLEWVVLRWRGPGLLLYLLAGAVMFRRPLNRFAQRAIPAAPNVRKTIVWILLALAALAVFVVPFPYSVATPARVEPWGQYVIYLLPDGYVRTEWYEHGQAEFTHTWISKLVASGFTTLNLQPAVSVGDTVRSGDTVLRIAADQFASLHDEAQSALAAKQAELDLLLAGARTQEIARAAADLDKEEEILKGAERDLLRADSLQRKNLLPVSEWEREQTAVQTQRARVESARQTLELLKAPPKPEEVAKLRAEIAQLTTQERYYLGQLESTVLTAPVAGVVLRLASHEGEICRIATLDSVRCVMDVDESDLPLLAVGQAVTLKVRSQPFSRFEGRLIYVSALGDTTRASSNFQAVAGFDNSSGIAPGASGYAKVRTGSRTLAWRVSRAVIRFIRIEFWSWW
jgi:putative peptide zinc metalloprotease protein